MELRNINGTVKFIHIAELNSCQSMLQVFEKKKHQMRDTPQ